MENKEDTNKPEKDCLQILSAADMISLHLGNEVKLLKPGTTMFFEENHPVQIHSRYIFPLWPKTLPQQFLLPEVFC